MLNLCAYINTAAGRQSRLGERLLVSQLRSRPAAAHQALRNCHQFMFALVRTVFYSTDRYTSAIPGRDPSPSDSPTIPIKGSNTQPRQPNPPVEEHLRLEGVGTALTVLRDILPGHHDAIEALLHDDSAPSSGIKIIRESGDAECVEVVGH